MSDPDYQLHADYDRDGRLAASTGEYGQRAKEPGAVVVPNLDADRRKLPRAVAATKPVTRDFAQPVKLAADDENLPLRIRTVKASAPANAQFFLRIVGQANIYIELHDSGGIILQHPAGTQTEIPFVPPAAGKDLNVTLEVQALAGTSESQSSLLETHFEFDQDSHDEAAFTIELRSRVPGQADTVYDSAFFTIAPAVVLDNAAPAVRVYIAALIGNEGSVAELGDALAGTGVELVQVPGEVSGGDTWLQDQFQHTLVQGADGFRQLLIHLPRMHNSNAVSGTVGTNLEGFVSGHFPSHDLGVFDALWSRTFVFNDAAGKVAELSFRDAQPIANVMSLAPGLWFDLRARILRVNPDARITFARGWTEKLKSLPDLLAQLRGEAPAAGRKKVGAGEMAGYKERFDELQTFTWFDKETESVFVPRIKDGKRDPNNQWLSVSVDTADKLFLRIFQAHSSANYGGNFEASPPVKDAALGKLLIGNPVFEDADFVDPDLFRLFVMQNKQPIVTIDTAWLEVGHVDEVIGFAPDIRQANPGFAILRASSGLALRLLTLARDRYVAGLPADHPHRKDPSKDDPSRLTVDGTSPVTRLFRGKLWRHIDETGSGMLARRHEPPLIYQAVADIGYDEVFYTPGAGKPRAYPADITVRELVFCEKNAAGASPNDFIEATFLAPIAKTMKTNFPDARLFPLPVLFDRVEALSGWKDDSRVNGTSAFIPAAVNFQSLAGRLVVPRPYGPRMKVDDVRAVLGTVFDELELPSRMLARLTPAFIKKNALETGVYSIQPTDSPKEFIFNTRSSPPRELVTKDDLIAQLRDSFPGASDADLDKKIIQPNRKNIDAQGNLRDEQAFKYTVTDGMLDLFETYVQLIAAELDVPLFWCDSWHYHVLLGGIHCGTNVLRQKPRSGVPKFWTVKGVQQLKRETSNTSDGS